VGFGLKGDHSGLSYLHDGPRGEKSFDHPVSHVNRLASTQPNKVSTIPSLHQFSTFLTVSDSLAATTLLGATATMAIVPTHCQYCGHETRKIYCPWARPKRHLFRVVLGAALASASGCAFLTGHQPLATSGNHTERIHT
jgi:hypothetical protein